MTKLILCGGFLGAGKTTLLSKLAEKYAKIGTKAGLITNDQATALVDTAMLKKVGGDNVEEVSGSCFCCNFPGFAKAVDYLKNTMKAEVIIAEPVGSCTDLSATIMQPLKKYAEKDLQIAPLSVLVDPHRLKATLNDELGGLHPSAAYIVRKQLEEADIIVITKTDLLTEKELTELKTKAEAKFTKAKVFAISSVRDTGIDEWLIATNTATKAGMNLTEVDYDTYAEGEAVLGWLNTTVEITGTNVDFDTKTRTFATNLAAYFDANKMSVGHVKLMTTNVNTALNANITGTKETLLFRGKVEAGNTATITVNARVETTPEKLAEVVRAELNKAFTGTTLKETAFKCLQPGRPNPTYHFTEVI